MYDTVRVHVRDHTHQLLRPCLYLQQQQGRVLVFDEEEEVRVRLQHGKG
jgi:hypothetical protein